MHEPKDDKTKRVASILTRSLFRGVSKSRRAAPPAPERPCVVCGKPKRHNNAFCSAECCRTYTRNRAAEKVG